MDVRYINPFLEATVNVLGQFGVADVRRESCRRRIKCRWTWILLQ
jgi:CheY-specific phosphatase CheX